MEQGSPIMGEELQNPTECLRYARDIGAYGGTLYLPLL